MHDRYLSPVMTEIWSEEAKFRFWIMVEVAVLRAKKKLGLLPPDLVIDDDLEELIAIDVAEIARLEKGTKHDVIAFVMHTAEQLPSELRPYWHGGMTSYDTQDTALMMQLQQSSYRLQEALLVLQTVLRKRAHEFKDTPMMGRTHGVHAEPITFGVKLANWFAESSRHLERLERLDAALSVGKISGAVGMYTLDPRVETLTCELLSLTPITATQIISRDIITDYVSTLVNLGAFLAKIATNIRLLQQTEIREVQEYFAKEQRGSSAMPHKRNPIGCENIAGQARTLQGYMLAALENQVTWHERDLTNSGCERNTLPEVSHLTHYMLVRLTKILKKLIVYPERMLANIDLLKGLAFSQDVQKSLAEKSGLPREDAYEIVRLIAQRCLDENSDFREALLSSEAVRAHLTEAEIDGCFDLWQKLQYVDDIFDRVFGSW